MLHETHNRLPKYITEIEMGLEDTVAVLQRISYDGIVMC